MLNGEKESMKSYGITNIGKVRLKNDDSFYCSDGKKGLYIVADGMGGYKGGELASKIAVATAVEELKDTDEITPEIASTLVEKIRIYLEDEVKKNPSLRDMGTTLICALSHGRDFSCLHIGDSRAYHILGKRIQQLTEDHTLVNILYKSGVLEKEELPNHPKRSVLMKAISLYGDNEADVFNFNLDKEEYLLLCSDGLTDQLTNTEILNVFKMHNEPEKIGKELVRLALESGGRDNIAVVVVKA
jgi:protein phosphatase